MYEEHYTGLRDVFDVVQTLEISQALSFKINHLLKWNQLEGGVTETMKSKKSKHLHTTKLDIRVGFISLILSFILLAIYDC